jgi:hypothetical protein
MAGLSNFITNTANQSTSMPTWYDQAQQTLLAKQALALVMYQSYRILLLVVLLTNLAMLLQIRLTKHKVH